MNFIEEVEKGRLGRNAGLPTGIPALDRDTDGVQKKCIYGVGAAPKVGKTTFVDYAFVLSPYLYLQTLTEESDVEIDWIYNSYEIDRVRKELKFACFFFSHDHNMNNFTHKGKIYEISARYLQSKMKDEDEELILLKDEHLVILKQIYEERIIPLFGEFNRAGHKIKPGLIKDFLEERENPTGIRNYLLKYATDNGKFIYENYKDKTGAEKRRRIGYKANNPNKYVIIITDHIRKLKGERGFTTKQNIDKFIEYQVEFRNWCGWTFVDICHLNRGMADVQRMKFSKDTLYPTGEDFKDTGNLSEEADIIYTMMNPNDEKYQLQSHFNLDLRDGPGNLLYPNYRSLHLVESRDTECPVHYQLNMFGNINTFKSIH